MGILNLGLVMWCSRRALWIGITVTAAVLAVAVFRPGRHLFATRGGFDEIPAVGFKTYEFCFKQRVPLTFIDASGTRGTVLGAFAAAFNSLSRRVAEVRGQSLCPSGVNIDWAEDEMRTASRAHRNSALQSFAFVQDGLRNSATLRLQFVDNTLDRDALLEVCSVLARHGFPPDFHIQANAPADAGSIQCDHYLVRR